MPLTLRRNSHRKRASWSFGFADSILELHDLNGNFLAGAAVLTVAALIIAGGMITLLMWFDMQRRALLVLTAMGFSYNLGGGQTLPCVMPDNGAHN